MGHSSRGCFLRTEGGLVLFLSREPFRGPLTLNVRDAGNRLGALVPGDGATLGDGRIRFEKMRVEVPGRTRWQPPAPPAAVLPGLAARHARLMAAMEAAKGVFAPPSLGALRAGLALRDVAATLDALGALLGAGEGLTPLGDDVVLGLLLALNRDPAPPWPTRNLAALNEGATRLARQRTTALSASLIECAAHGEADERLLAAADHLLAGTPSFDDALQGLIGWGASSGAGVLAGLGVVGEG